MTYKVYTTETFDKEISKLEKDYQKRIEKLFLQLKDNPYGGNQLRYRNLREKRVKEKRVYYLVYDNLKIILMVAISGKKNQQTTIDYLIKNFDKYEKYLERFLGKI